MHLDPELYRHDVWIPEPAPARLSVIDVDPGEARGTMLLIHGYGGTASQWTHQIRHFAEEWRIIAPDLRGHGLSDAPRSAYTLEELERDVELLLDRVEAPERLTVVAHSFGGAVAARFAVAHPERVERLVLIGAASDFRFGLGLQIAFRAPTVIMERVRRRFLPKLYAPAAVLKKLYFAAVRPFDGSVLERVSSPTLVIRGHRDFVFPAAAYDAVTKLVPGAQEVMIPVSAHLVHLERPDAVNRAIQRFLGPTATAWREAREAERARRMRERPWLGSMAPGVPHTILPPRQPLHAFLESSARRFGARPASRFFGATLTWRAVDRLANRVAHALARLGVGKGDRVMLILPNIPAVAYGFYGALKAGATVVPMSPLATTEELERVMSETGCAVVMALDRHVEAAATAAAKAGVRHVVVAALEDDLPWHRRISFGPRGSAPRSAPHPRRPNGAVRLRDLIDPEPEDPPRVPVSPGDLALIAYTSGTTDRQRGVMLTHANLVANTLQLRHWYADADEGQERMLAVLPISHLYGLTACLNLSAFLGAAMILLPDFVVNEVVSAIRLERPTLFPGVPEMFIALNSVPGVRRAGLRSIRVCISGSAPLPVEVAEAFMKLTKGQLSEGYGLTEASPITHANPLGGPAKLGAIGIPLPSTEARIVDPGSGRPLPAGEIGELCVRGPQVMRGYWNDPDATARALDSEGWLRTGDLARMHEDGYFQLIDRRAHVWQSRHPSLGGRPVYPREIEEVLYEHPTIREVVVVPVGDEPHAFVILKPGERAVPDELIRFCRTRLEDHLVPAEIVIRDELPRTHIGKVKRWELTRETRRT